MQINKWTRIELFVYSSLVFFGLLAVWSAFVRPFGHDEFEAIHTAWKMWSGERIYLDFFQHHHFLYYPILGWLISIFSESVNMVLAARGLSLMMALGIVWITYRIGTLRYTREIALLAVFLLTTTFIFLDKVLEVRPDVPQALSGLIAIFFWLQYDENKKRGYLILTAFALFVSFLFLQKAVFLIALLGLYTLYRLIKKTLPFADFLLLWGILSSFLLFVVGYLVQTGIWSEYFFLNWTVNTRLLNTFSPLEYLWFSMIENPVLWLVYFGGSGWFLITKKIQLISYLALGLLMSVFLARTPFAQYYLMALPLVSLIAAETSILLMRRFKEVPVLCLLGLSVLYPAFLVYDEAHKTNREQFAKIEYVLSVTAATDLVYDGDANFNLFRKDMDYFWFSVKPKKGVLAAYQTLRPYEYDPYLLIQSRQPKLISDSFLSTKNPIIRDGYTRSEKYKDFWIRK